MGELKSPKTFKVVTLGCRTNQYESQAYQNQLEALGCCQAIDGEEADLCIVNTCTVTEAADSSSRREIRQLVRDNPTGKVIVTGCFAERARNDVAAIEGVDAVVGNSDKESLVASLFPDQEVPEFNIKNFDAHTRAFVKVQDGCNSFCTYCIIPYVRGRSRSRTIDDILCEVEGLIANGYKEIVLTGINIGDFDGGSNGGESRLGDLVRAVDKVPGLERLRLSSIDPDEVDDDLMDAIINGKRTCHSLHIVLQSGSNVILKRMNRKYTRQIFLQTVDRLKRASPRFTFTTDVIVGFPGETDGDHRDTLEVIEEVRFAKVHMFPFSVRQRTRAALMPNKVAGDLIKERKQQVLRAAEKGAYALRSKYVGERVIVLTEGCDGLAPGWITGHTDNFLSVTFPQGHYQSNELVSVRLTKNEADALHGVVCA